MPNPYNNSNLSKPTGAPVSNKETAINAPKGLMPQHKRMAMGLPTNGETNPHGDPGEGKGDKIKDRY